MLAFDIIVIRHGSGKPLFDPPLHLSNQSKNAGVFSNNSQNEALEAIDEKHSEFYQARNNVISTHDARAWRDAQVASKASLY